MCVCYTEDRNYGKGVFAVKFSLTKRSLWVSFFVWFACLLLLTGCAESSSGASDSSSDSQISVSSHGDSDSTDDVSSEDGTEYLWRVSIPTGTGESPPRPYLVFGETLYHVRKNTPEVETLSDAWTQIGTVNVSIDWRENTYDVAAETDIIVSNCVPKGAKVYRWKYYLAVECGDFYVIFQDDSIS